MSEFQQPLGSLLAMPKKQFFWLVNMAPRVRAERDLRLLNILLTSQSGQKDIEKIADGLKIEMGVIYERAPVSSKTIKIWNENEPDPEFDREALRALKAKHGV